MEKEKQAFEIRCIECGGSKNLTMLPHRDKDGDMVGVLYACEECRETVQGSECIVDARRDKEIATLKAEIENVRKNAEHWYNERNIEIKKHQAEIERKDTEIRRALLNIRAGHVGLAIEALEQALSEEE